MTARGLLNRMVNVDSALYEKILDTPGFAKAFNDLSILAVLSEDMLVVLKQVASEASANQRNYSGRTLDWTITSQTMQLVQDTIANATGKDA